MVEVAIIPLKLNVLNLDVIERELRIISARTFHPAARRWFDTVARNYIINLTGQEADPEYEFYTGQPAKKGIHTDQPPATALPEWAVKAQQVGTDIHFFNPAQPRRRDLWRALETIADWFNTWKADDTAIGRLDRVNFPQAREQAVAWRAEIDKNPWLHIKDKPRVVKRYEDGSGLYWVILSTDMHMQREGNLMHHCVGGGGYVNQMKSGQNEYYSLRDAKNEPHCTVEVRVQGGTRHVFQAKGKQNAKAIAKYQPYLRDLVTQPGWSVKGDQGYVDL